MLLHKVSYRSIPHSLHRKSSSFLSTWADLGQFLDSAIPASSVKVSQVLLCWRDSCLGEACRFCTEEALINCHFCVFVTASPDFLDFRCRFFGSFQLVIQIRKIIV